MYHYRSSYGSHSPVVVFPAHFFFSMLFARSTQAKRHGAGRIFYLCNPFSTFNGYDIYFDEVSPIPGKGIQLRSTTPIYISMAPGRV